MAALSSRSKAVLVATLLIACCFALFFLRSAYQSGDSLIYASAARSGGADMFHPHHLIFGPVVHILTAALSALFIPSDVITVGQIHNIIWAAVSLLAVYALVMFWTSRFWFALAVMLALFATRGVLTFTSWMEVYAPALGALCLVAWAALTAPAGRISNGRMLLCVLFYSLAVLYHQTNVLFAIPLAIYFTRSKSRHFQDWFVLVVCSGSLVLAAYILAYFQSAETRSLAGFINFCLAYLSHPSTVWGSSGNLSPAGLQGVVSSQVWNIVALNSRTARAVVALLLMLLLLLNIWKGARRASLSPERSFLVAWVAAYWIFFLWWLPYQVEFFLVSLFPVTVLAAITLHEAIAFRRLQSRISPILATILVAVLAGYLAVHNLPSVWDQHVDRGESYRKAKELSRFLAPDLIVMTDYETGANIRFHFHHDSVIETVIPLLLFYRHRDLPQDYSSIAKKRCLVELSEVDPSYSIMGFSGYTHPSEWLNWFKWLLGFQCEREGTCSLRTFSIMQDSGRTFLLLNHERENVPVIGEVLSRLDPYAMKNCQQPFGEWLTQNRQ